MLWSRIEFMSIWTTQSNIVPIKIDFVAIFSFQIQPANQLKLHEPMHSVRSKALKK